MVGFDHRKAANHSVLWVQSVTVLCCQGRSLLTVRTLIVGAAAVTRRRHKLTHSPLMSSLSLTRDSLVSSGVSRSSLAAILATASLMGEVSILQRSAMLDRRVGYCNTYTRDSFRQHSPAPGSVGGRGEGGGEVAKMLLSQESNFKSNQPNQ